MVDTILLKVNFISWRQKSRLAGKLLLCERSFNSEVLHDGNIPALFAIGSSTSYEHAIIWQLTNPRGPWPRIIDERVVPPNSLSREDCRVDSDTDWPAGRIDYRRIAMHSSGVAGGVFCW